MRIWNCLLVGVGGTGVITLKRIIEHAGLQNQKVCKIFGAEKHGLAQREGSVDVHVRFLILDDNEKQEDDEYYLSAPTIPFGEAEFCIGIEPLELLRDAKFISQNATVIMNTYSIWPPSTISEEYTYPSIQRIEELIKEISKVPKIIIVDATNIAIQEMGSPIYTNNILLGVGLATGTMPITKENVVDALKKQVGTAEKNIKSLEIGIELGLKLTKKE
ncbi:MAG: 2-oxoacid:acceptor oxidoreductase family protein [Candidatus Helarchaeota archaeon]